MSLPMEPEHQEGQSSLSQPVVTDNPKFTQVLPSTLPADTSMATCRAGIGAVPSITATAQGRQRRSGDSPLPGKRW